jgi:hypothetical protein
VKVELEVKEKELVVEVEVKRGGEKGVEVKRESKKEVEVRCKVK